MDYRVAEFFKKDMLMNGSFTLRDVRLDDDLPRLTEMYNLVDTVPNTPEDVRRWFERQAPGLLTRRRVVDVNGTVAGYSSVIHEPWHPPGQYAVYVLVHPDARRQGIGSALAADIQAFLETCAIRMLKSEVRENDPAGMAFSLRYGFAIDRHLYESALDLETFDETPYAEVIPALEAAGFHFFSLAERINDPQAGRKLYDLNRATVLDIPGREGDWLPFDEFEKQVMGADWFNPHGQFFVSDGDPAQGAAWVGLGPVRLVRETGMAYNLMTGVLPAYRGRKLALALKLTGIRYARQSGAHSLRTNNDSLNAPMLAINHKLGYQPQPGVYFLKRVYQ